VNYSYYIEEEKVFLQGLIFFVRLSKADTNFCLKMKVLVDGLDTGDPMTTTTTF
jgi:hypothetical protein